MHNLSVQFKKVIAVSRKFTYGIISTNDPNFIKMFILPLAITLSPSHKRLESALSLHLTYLRSCLHFLGQKSKRHRIS